MSLDALEALGRLFQGVIPAVIATADAEGTPNVAFVSQVHRVDGRHVALSRQFFNKTSRNLEQNPFACATLYDPLGFDAWRIHLRHLRCETAGALFDAMALRIEAIAAHTGMSGVFKLVGADVFEVERVEAIEGFQNGPRPEAAGARLDGHRTELRGLQWVSDSINRATDLESLLDGVLRALDEYFGFRHTRVLLWDQDCGPLVTLASRGYEGMDVGAEVRPQDGWLAAVAREQRLLRLTGLQQDLAYGRAVRRELVAEGAADLGREIPLPGLPDAHAALAIPLSLRGRLVGVLTAESRDPIGFDEWHEAYLQVVGNQIAQALVRMLESDAEDPAPPPPAVPVPAGPQRTFVLYRNDDAVFVDGEYLIRNVPARILWRVLRQFADAGRTEFTNRELRLDTSLGLPELRDNLESRLILLRKRLEAKCPDVRLVPAGRGRFRLCAQPTLKLVEKDSA
jgi:hypothetical protein